MFENGSTKFYLGIILLSSLILKLIIFCMLSYLGADFTLPDLPTYMRPTLALLAHKNFFLSQALWERTPLYPLFLAAIFKVFGIHFGVVVLIQILLSSLLVYNSFRITQLLANEQLGLYAALIVAVDYLIISYSNQIMTDLLYATLFSYFFYYGIQVLKTKLTFKRIALMGILLAVCTLIRPVSYYLIPIMGVAVFGYALSRQTVVTALSYTVLFMLPCVLLVGGWQYRNKQVVGSYQLTNVDALNLYHYYAADVLSRVEHKPIAEVQQNLYHQAVQMHFKSSAALYAYYRHEGSEILMQHPMLAVEQGVAGLFRTLFGNDYTLLYYNKTAFTHGKQLESYLFHLQFKQFLQYASLTDLAKMAMIVLFFIFNFLLVMGALYYLGYQFVMRSDQQAPLCFVLIVIAYFCVVSSNYCSLARFRMPFQIMIDGLGVLGLYQCLAALFTENNIFSAKEVKNKAAAGCDHFSGDRMI